MRFILIDILIDFCHFFFLAGAAAGFFLVGAGVAFPLVAALGDVCAFLLSSFGGLIPRAS
jgi:hypothetical protein